MDLGGTNGLIIGAAGPTGTELAKQALHAGVGRLVLCDTAAAGQITAPSLDPLHPQVVLEVVRLQRGDPIELAQLFACVRHDHGPLDWVCTVSGPGAPVAPSSTGTRGGTAVLAEVIELVPTPPPSPWPELSLARIVARTEQAFVRSALITRLALEEFRHRGGALLHVWVGEAKGPPDALWEANRAAVEALVRAGTAPSRPIDGRGDARIGFVETSTGTVPDLGDRLRALLGRQPAPAVSLIRDNP